MVSTPPPDTTLELSTTVYTINITRPGSHYAGATIAVTAALEAILSVTSFSQTSLLCSL